MSDGITEVAERAYIPSTSSVIPVKRNLPKQSIKVPFISTLREQFSVN